MAVNFHESFVFALDELEYPVYWELFDGKKEVPCITYMEVFNADLANGDTLSYSSIVFQAKVWAYKISDIQTMFKEIDNTLKPLGFKRVFSAESAEGKLLSKTARYQGIGYERF